MTALSDALTNGTAHALLVDAAVCTPQLRAFARDTAVPLISVGGAVAAAAGELHDTFRVEELLHVLVGLPAKADAAVPLEHRSDTRRHVIAVIGAAGAGTSTVAAMLAQDCARDCDDVLLADLCRDATQAALHDVTEPVDGVFELAFAPEKSPPFLPAVTISARGYRLVLGMRQPLQWVAMRPQHTDRIMTALVAGEGMLVCDVDAEVESEDDTGSVGVGDRHRLTGAALAAADQVVVVVDASLVGVMRGVALLAAVSRRIDADVPVVTVMNRQRGMRQRPRQTYAAAFTALLDAHAGVARPVRVVGVVRFDADGCHLAVRPFPSRLTQVVGAPLARQRRGAA